MLLPTCAVLAGLLLMIWSADRFVEGAAATAHHFSVPPLIVGMVIVGFGTSAPEMVVSVMAAGQGNPQLAMGNAWGSNITNIALILGLTALLYPVTVHSTVLRKELPILMGITLLSGWLLMDNALSMFDAIVLLLVFGALTAWTLVTGMRNKTDALASETAHELETHDMPLRRALMWLAAGLILLVVSSRLLVWGAVAIAQSMGVSDLVIGLTIVAVGTSLPELASCIAAARKGEHDIALGNVLGSNLFNSLAVVGLAGVIAPTDTDPALMWRDWPVMAGLTAVLFVMGWGWRGLAGRINRWEAAGLLAAYVAYIFWLMQSVRQGL